MPMPITDQLLKAIADAQENGETLYRIAKESGVNHTALTRFVTGERRDIRVSTADKLAAYLGLSLTPDKRKK